MSKKDKLTARLKSRPRDFTFDEMSSLLVSFGYRHVKSGKTSGSRVRFTHNNLPTITLHKPHPGNVLKLYQIDQIKEMLTKEGVL